ncbi:unnamed protein product [Moneuplotes crassus]|uniref:Uncharacterized protein n=1 Tax=Euplotes crassus TaxID=5936 RepID=A0AAD1UFY2_EUPCR|nr:unnamed protein product [Moneuplotes crassus]
MVKFYSKQETIEKLPETTEEEIKVNTQDREDDQLSFESNWEESVEQFDDLDLKEEVLKGIYDYGFEKPSPVQQKAILPMLQGRDTVVQAQAGAGKTFAFIISALQIVDTSLDQAQVLILAPARELCYCIGSIVESIGKHTGVKALACCGGTHIRDNIRKLKEGFQIIVGTPGRIHDMMRKDFLQVVYLKLIVMDEADEMLSRGYKEQIQEIFKILPGDTRAALFSPTMPPDILLMSENFMREPAKILRMKNSDLQSFGQYYVLLGNEKQKFDELIDLLMKLDSCQAIIYCNTTKKVDELAKDLKSKDFSCCAIHQEMDQESIDFSMREFGATLSKFLVSTGLYASQIYTQNASVIINYDLPLKKESYVHRICSLSRINRNNTAINLTTSTDSSFLEEIETYYGTEINKLPDDLTLV